MGLLLLMFEWHVSSSSAQRSEWRWKSVSQSVTCRGGLGVGPHTAVKKEVVCGVSLYKQL